MPPLAVAHDGGKRLHQTFGTDDSSVLKTTNNGTCCERTIDEVLPEAMLMEIMSRLPQAKDLWQCINVNQTFRSSFPLVKAVRFQCKLEDIRKSPNPTPFKDTVTGTLKKLLSVERLSLEIEDEMQAERLKCDEIKSNNLWLTEKTFIPKWLMPVKHSLQNLTVIDYGQQAIFRATPLLHSLADHCKQLRTVELRNMYLDCRNVGTMNKVTTLTLRCVKLTENGLEDLSTSMPMLETLTLVTVVGLKQAVFSSKNLKILCLGLATRVTTVKLTVQHLVKLQLKMACPDNLIVNAPDLQCLAVCMDKREKAIVQFERVKLLKELLMGASEFTTLSNLTVVNPGLEKVFLDVPCMAFDDSGSWRGVLEGVNLAIPDMDAIRSCCPNLHTLSVGPGLWWSLEEDETKKGSLTLKWPALRRLILHLIVQDKNLSINLLTRLVKAIPSLSTLEVYVHTHSSATDKEFRKLLKSQFPHLDPICDTWTKGLRFECFSF